MNNLILVDGNNLLFRSYYATAYSGNFMKNSKGFPTNGLLGFMNMMNKIINEEKPTHIIVAFDKGKTFRHEKYKEYKAGRMETPNELKQQFPVAKELLKNMGITYYEIENYEADDIIGTFAKFCEENDDYTGTIISSDRDLLQLISNTVDIKLLKSKDYIRYNVKTFTEEYGIEPINIIDLKALMGDTSDNIPGVKGIGEKTALKLLNKYKTLDGIYENIDNISESTKEKLILDKENAYKSYDLATIYKEVPITINLSDLEYKGPNITELNKLLEELEFYSFLKKKENISVNIECKVINNINEISVNEESAIYIELKGTNYHNSDILGISIYNKENAYYIPFNILKENLEILNSFNFITYDMKRLYVSLKKQGINIKTSFDTMLAAYLLEYNVKDDIAYLANQFDFEIPFEETFYGKKYDSIKTNEEIAKYSILKAKFIYDTKKEFVDKLNSEGMKELFNNIEMPLSTVLGDMEFNGINVNIDTLDAMGNEIKNRVDVLSKEIYEMSGTEFNIASPIQLSEILFEKLGLPHGKKGKTGYSTAGDVLTKLRDKHPIIDKIIEYRNITKLYNTYIEGLKKEVVNGKIHTIYKQALTRTGRISSQEPNLQNIPARDEYGKLIRKAFVPSNNSIIISADYSQIELRVLASIANVESLINAFNNNIDIHTKTASDIFHKSVSEVTQTDRRMAKAVNFGIIYGISGFGLSNNLNISTSDAKKFIDEYLNTYPGIKNYMDETIKNAHLNGYVKTLFNRKRIIPELQNANYMIRQTGERMALNTPIQGTSADIIKMAMVMVDKKIKENNLKSKMILQIHDELVIDTYKDEIDKVKEILISSMENVCNLRVPLKVDVNMGDNLYEAK